MNGWTLLTVGAVAFTLAATPALAQSASAPSASPRSTDSRPDIEQVQKALKEKGHDPGRIDGVMGPQTSAALKAFQKEQRLNATGRLDDATQAKLGASARTDASGQGASGQGASGQARPTGSEQTGGDTKPSAVDPAQSNKTGANVGEGASYSRSTEKGASK